MYSHFQMGTPVESIFIEGFKSISQGEVFLGPSMF